MRRQGASPAGGKTPDRPSRARFRGCSLASIFTQHQLPNRGSNARATARCRLARAAGWSGRARSLRSSTRVISDGLDLVEKRLGIGVKDALALVAAEINGFALVDELRFGRVGCDLHHANRIQCHGWPPLSRLDAVLGPQGPCQAKPMQIRWVSRIG